MIVFKLKMGWFGLVRSFVMMYVRFLMLILILILMFLDRIGLRWSHDGMTWSERREEIGGFDMGGMRNGWGKGKGGGFRFLFYSTLTLLYSAILYYSNHSL